MGIIARIADSVSNAADRTIETAHQAEDAGWQNVNTGWDPTHQTYTVSADKPTDTTGR
jgi:hypothetical protein